MEVPRTPAGSRLEHLIGAINAEDPGVTEAFVADEMGEEFLSMIPPERHVAVLRSLRGDSPPIVLCRIESSTDDEVVALLGGVNDKSEVEYARTVLTVGGEQHKVASLMFEPANAEDLTREIEPLDEDAVRRSVEVVADGLADYVYADKVETMQRRLLEAMEAGEYAGISNPRHLAKRLTADLVAVTGDKHLGVTYSASKLPPPRPDKEMTPEEIEGIKKRAASDNFGMPVAEVRDGNVGYLKVLGFLPPEVAAEAVSVTMSKLAEADVLVIDLRQNRGGSPDGVALMTSYLFGNKRVHLNDLYNRSKDETKSYYTTPDAPGAHFGPRKPIFVLVSHKTFSAGEEFAYNLQALNRATIVGETTGGGAHPVTLVRVSDHWGVILPNARAINPITKKNWEGTGVEPDVAVPEDEALDKALELAAKRK